MVKNDQLRGDIRTLAEGLADRLVVLVRQAALDQVRAALGERGGRASAKRGRPRRSAPAGRRGSGGKRSSVQVAQVCKRLLAYVKHKPGQRGEQIAKAFRTDTTTMRLPMRKLITAKKVKTKGQRRGMKYFAA